MLPRVTGEFGIVMDPEIKFSEKGTTWVKIRGVAKDRVRDSNGTWADGDPCFIDIVAFGTYAENIAESVSKGDSVIVEGHLQYREYTDNNGVSRSSYTIKAEYIGPSVKWGAAKTVRTLETSGVATATAGLSASPVEQSSESPF